MLTANTSPPAIPHNRPRSSNVSAGMAGLPGAGTISHSSRFSFTDHANSLDSGCVGGVADWPL